MLRRLTPLLAVAAVVMLALAGCTTAASLPAPIQKQMDYAQKYWNHYNVKVYGDFNDEGGDCANFVSQTLAARGWKMNSEWYSHDGGTDWSAAWVFAPTMDDYFADHAKQLGLTEYSFADLAHIRDGDVAMFDWGDGTIDHVMVVTNVVDTTVNGKEHVQVYLTGHNKNDRNKSLATILKEYPHATGHFWHIALPSTASPTPSASH